MIPILRTLVALCARAARGFAKAAAANQCEELPTPHGYPLRATVRGSLPQISRLVLADWS